MNPPQRKKDAKDMVPLQKKKKVYSFLKEKWKGPRVFTCMFIFLKTTGSFTCSLWRPLDFGGLGLCYNPAEAKEHILFHITPCTLCLIVLCVSLWRGGNEKINVCQLSSFETRHTLLWVVYDKKPSPVLDNLLGVITKDIMWPLKTNIQFLDISHITHRSLWLQSYTHPPELSGFISE